MDFSNYSRPRFLLGGGACAGFVTTDIGYYGGGVGLNQNRFRPNGRAKRARRRVQGPTQASWWSPGTAPTGVQGAEPPEAPGVLGFLRPQNASRIFFFSFLRQVLLQNQSTMLIYTI